MKSRCLNATRATTPAVAREQGNHSCPARRIETGIVGRPDRAIADRRGGIGNPFSYVGESGESEAELRRGLSHQTDMLDEHPLITRLGDPQEIIVQTACELKAEIIVLCKNSNSHPQPNLGRTATAVLRESPCPLILVPPERGLTSWYLHHILVPHDGTPTTSASLKPAVDLADRAGAELLVAHITDSISASKEPGTLTSPRYVDQPQYEWAAWGSEFANRLACICPLGHVHLRVFLGHGDPAAEILRLSERHSSDMIVLAWRGEWEVPRAAILKEVLRRAHCPVFVLRTGETGGE